MAAAQHLGDGVGGRDDAGLGAEHLLDAFGADLGARHHHEHEGGHHDAHQDLQQVGEERGECADLHVAAVDPVGAEPQDGDAGDVDDQHHAREQVGHQLADLQRDAGEVLVGVGEPVLLVVVLDEGADDPDAGDLLAQHPVHGVDLVLHAAEARAELAHEHGDHDGEGGDDGQQQAGERHVLVEGHDDAADAHDRRRDHHGERHQHQHLDLLDVVGGAGDEGRGAELADLAGGEALDAVEDGGADVAADGHGGARPVVDGADRAEGLEDGDADHHGAHLQDVAGVPLDHAAVDDVGVECGQVEQPEGGHQLEQHQQGDRSGIGAEVRP